MVDGQRNRVSLVDGVDLKCHFITIVEGVYIRDNEEKSAASVWHQVAAWFPDMFCDLNLVKNHKIDNNSATTEARE